MIADCLNILYDFRSASGFRLNIQKTRGWYFHKISLQGKILKFHLDLKRWQVFLLVKPRIWLNFGIRKLRKLKHAFLYGKLDTCFIKVKYNWLIRMESQIYCMLCKWLTLDHNNKNLSKLLNGIFYGMEKVKDKSIGRYVWCLEM